VTLPELYFIKINLAAYIKIDCRMEGMEVGKSCEVIAIFKEVVIMA
jgi:hypothetical protein